MSTLESTLARLKIEDRIREANQQRLAHEFHRRELPSTTPTAVREPDAHGPSDMAPDNRTMPQSRQLKGLVADPGGGKLAEPEPSQDPAGPVETDLVGLACRSHTPEQSTRQVSPPGGGRPAHGGRSSAVFAATAVLLLLLTACSGGSEQASGRLDAAQLVHDVQQDLSSDPDHDALRALIVQVHGKPVVEKYFGGASSDSYWETASVTKSFLSTLVGIAIADGKISGVDATLAELLPSHARQMTPPVARTRLRHVLTMTGGFAGTEADLLADMSAPDPVGTILRGSRGARGGFVYSDEGAHIVAAILAEATGSSVLEYARDRLFAPLGIKGEPAFEARITPTGPIADELAAKYVAADFAWPTDSRGTHTGWGLLKLRPLDLVKLGQLFLDHGRWRGKQVVPAPWVRDATSAQIQGAAGNYGYEWWVTEADGEPAYHAMGFGGQLIEVVPNRALVVVMATEIDPSRAPGSGFTATLLGQVVNDTIAPAVAR